MKKLIIYRFALAASGAVLVGMFATHAQAVVPANYSRACTEAVASVDASPSFVEKALYARRAARRTARRTVRRHTY
ncbi:hypothetical protein SAMN05444581_101516 [Methylocapsa palsarum]|uniref:Uncharacterized protein n=1 Tax=Methylocapsa palsarum TaxID=1612308 RepID=A0A1I3WC14_9HYPH|nr:hypothetical protein SAMN05444581_101516 [Methylocapsa palsarum]